MTKIYNCLLFLIFPIVSYGQKNLSGVFKTNFQTYGLFQTTLTLNCDSSAVLNFRGDFVNDNSIGIWTVKNNLLTLTFDSIKYLKQRYKGQSSFKIKRNRLYLISFSIESYEKLKVDLEKYSKEKNQKFKMPKYSKFERHSYITPKNVTGRTGKQYYKNLNKFDCDKIN